MDQAFQVVIEEDGIGWLTFDLPNEKVNKFSLPVLEQLEQHIDKLAQNPSLKALVIQSGKTDIFIAGADLHAFQEISKDISMAESLIRCGHRVFSKIENMP